jgi:hypothetical protein
MPVFQQKYPKRWRDMSVDFRLFFAYHISMMVMMIAGQGELSVRIELVITALLVMVLMAISIVHRKENNWRWPGVQGRDIVYAVGGVVLIALFLYGATPLFPPSTGAALPWYLAGLGIGTFNVLSSLKVVNASEADFLMNCRAVDQYGQEIPRASELPQPASATEPRWKKLARAIYVATFMLVWICGVLFFYVFGKAFKDGSLVPTVTQTAPLENHGETVFITPAEKERIHLLLLSAGVGFPVVIVSGLVLHFIVGVGIWGDTRTLSELLNKRKANL